MTETSIAPAPWGQRIGAGLIDAVTLGILWTVAWEVTLKYADVLPGWAIIAGVIGSPFVFGIYVVIAESISGQTLGKKICGVRVVRESGARAGVGRIIARILPWLLAIFWIDVLFMLFTTKRQRGFELITGTMVTSGTV